MFGWRGANGASVTSRVAEEYEIVNECVRSRYMEARSAPVQPTARRSATQTLARVSYASLMPFMKCINVIVVVENSKTIFNNNTFYII